METCNDRVDVLTKLKRSKYRCNSTILSYGKWMRVKGRGHVQEPTRCLFKNVNV